MNQIKYYSLKNYKYELAEDYQCLIKIHPINDLIRPYFTLTRTGVLVIKKGYMCDGPSGPTIDTHDFIRGAFVHDVLYQCMRLGLLDYKEVRKAADEELYRLCIEDGMAWWRAGYVYNFVRWFAEDCAKPRTESEIEILTAP